MQAPRKELRAWRFAGLLTTWWCNARCVFCYVCGSPEQGGALAPDDAVAFWGQLDRVAAKDGRRIQVHLTGGEPFGRFENLVAILQAANHADLPRPQKVETNAFWAADDDMTRERLEMLRSLGVPRLDISTDVFHQEFVPLGPVLRCVRIAREVFGPQGVRLRWEDAVRADPVWAAYPDDVGRRREAYVDSLHRHPERLTGRAAFTIAPLLGLYPPDHFSGQHCIAELLKSKHVHVGPDGSVFPGVCSGILLGNARAEPLDEMWSRLAVGWQDEPILAPLVDDGPLGLLHLAQSHGYTPLPNGYASKCHLCTHVRQFLFETGLWPKHLGPANLYQVAD